MRFVRLAVVLLVANALVGPAYADLTIILKNAFIDQYKDRATITATATVEFSHKKPKKPTESKPSNDGDIHAAVRSSDIQLATVAEMMNAADFLPIVKKLSDIAGTGESIALEGVWRLWPEHGSDETYRQGATIPPYPHTNPDHVFEIHPLTRVGTTDVKATFEGIPDFPIQRRGSLVSRLRADALRHHAELLDNQDRHQDGHVQLRRVPHSPHL